MPPLAIWFHGNIYSFTLSFLGVACDWRDTRLMLNILGCPELSDLLLPPPVCWNYRCVPPHHEPRELFRFYHEAPGFQEEEAWQYSASSSAELSLTGQTGGSNGWSAEPRRRGTGMRTCLRPLIPHQKPPAANWLQQHSRELERGHLCNRLQLPPRKAGHTLPRLVILRLPPEPDIIQVLVKGKNRRPLALISHFKFC